MRNFADRSNIQMAESLSATWYVMDSQKACDMIKTIVSYLTQVSDLDLAPDPDQFVASPPVRYIYVALDTLQRCPEVVTI